MLVVWMSVVTCTVLPNWVQGAGAHYIGKWASGFDAGLSAEKDATGLAPLTSRDFQPLPFL